MTKLTRRTFTASAAAAGLGMLATPLRAQAYPAGQTIKVIVPYPPGGATDIVGRVLAERLGILWKVPVVVENVPGAGANIGMDRVAKGPTDGTQILIIPPNITTNQFLYNRLAFDPEKDFTALTQVVSVPNLLCVRKGLEVNSPADLIAYAKANPGKLNYASSGIGTTIHLSAELFKKMAGVDMVHVAYRGSGPALNDLVGGTVDLMFDNIPSIINQARAGTVKPLGITTLKRSPFAPEYAPVADVLPGYDTTSWFGVGVRSGTPKEICDRIETDVRAICQEAPVRERFGTLVAETIGSDAAAFNAYIAAERAKWGKLINELKIKVE
ncbi:MAG: Bug family tripartite tricarboxylate transporter substrate binding protein [Hyphomicrobiaceae bacterium]